MDAAWINDHLICNGRINAHAARESWWSLYRPDDWLQLLECTKSLPAAATPMQRLWHVYHGVTEHPTCPICSGPTKFIKFKSGYTKHCSTACGNQSDAKTMFWQSDHGKAVSKQRGVKLKQYFSTDAGQQSLADRQIKTKQTNQSRYGVDNPLANTMIQSQVRSTMLQRHGADHPMKVDAIKQKVKSTVLERNGGKHYAQKHLSEQQLYYIEHPDELYKIHIEQKVPLNKLSLDLGYSEFYIASLFRKVGLKCNHQFNTGVLERQLADDLRLIEHNVIVNDRMIIKPKELDIVLPDKHLAIEVNGLYWHSEEQKGRTSHLDKLNQCEQAGYQLLQFWDCELEANYPLVLSMIKSRMGLSDQIDYARKCQISEITSQQASAFLNANHIQGQVSSSHRFGLIDPDGNLLSLMTFNRPKMRSQQEWELTRFCSRVGHNVIGGASKLFKHFINLMRPSSIVSYSDSRLFSGGMYPTLGFTLSHVTRPNYWYFSDDNRQIHRRSFQKHLLAKKLATFNPDQTEYQNMLANGWNRVFDCGNRVWVWTA